MRSKSCLCKNFATTSGPNVNDTPRSFSPQPKKQSFINHIHFTLRIKKPTQSDLHAWFVLFSSASEKQENCRMEFGEGKKQSPSKRKMLFRLFWPPHLQFHSCSAAPFTRNRIRTEESASCFGGHKLLTTTTQSQELPAESVTRQKKKSWQALWLTHATVQLKWSNCWRQRDKKGKHPGQPKLVFRTRKCLYFDVGYAKKV